jgi:hypothetical protein
MINGATGIRRAIADLSHCAFPGAVAVSVPTARARKSSALSAAQSLNTLSTNQISEVSLT